MRVALSKRQRDLNRYEHEKTDQEEQRQAALEAGARLEILAWHGQRPSPHPLADHDTRLVGHIATISEWRRQSSGKGRASNVTGVTRQ